MWLQHTALVATGLDGWLDRSDLVNQLVMSNLSIYIFSPDCVFKLHLWQINPQPFFNFISARKRWMRVNRVERMGLDICWIIRLQVCGTGGLRLAGIQGTPLDSSMLVVYLCHKQGKRVHLFVYSQQKSGSIVDGGAQDWQKIKR